jgi:hypothetical protein
MDTAGEEQPVMTNPCSYNKAAIIEHPETLPESWRRQGKLRKLWWPFLVEIPEQTIDQARRYTTNSCNHGIACNDSIT